MVKNYWCIWPVEWWRNWFLPTLLLGGRGDDSSAAAILWSTAFVVLANVWTSLVTFTDDSSPWVETSAFPCFNCELAQPEEWDPINDDTHAFWSRTNVPADVNKASISSSLLYGVSVAGLHGIELTSNGRLVFRGLGVPTTELGREPSRYLVTHSCQIDSADGPFT